ncbi:hypothetical protein NPIL_508801 [Nephila pilipes]|uniref:Uncharacterized protein n=1 Tax=Nephila pilipes TaxID=299642 RepID=A0A8X6TZH9_NEPPI|nr:hypothetical protein NPIL_508801 [Nephila pilipes]
MSKHNRRLNTDESKAARKKFFDGAQDTQRNTRKSGTSAGRSKEEDGQEDEQRPQGTGLQKESFKAPKERTASRRLQRAREAKL